MVFILVVFINAMALNFRKNQVQIMADSASRAGALAVTKSYAVRERTGYGMGDYHVYTELDPDHASDLADAVIQRFSQRLHGVTITGNTKNPVNSTYTHPVWNNRRFQYEEKFLSAQKQYKNGNFSVEINADVESVAKGFFGNVMDRISIQTYSQSAARGAVTNVR